MNGTYCPLHIVTGRGGSGKTDYLIDCLAEHMRTGKRALLIVPEQRTYEAEKRVSARLGGMLGVQVLSMERLCERTLQQGGDKRTFLTGQGVRMAIRSAIHRRAPELRCFGRMTGSGGFAGEIASVISSCKQACITAQMLLEASEQLSSRTMLSDKLHDVGILYEELDKTLQDRYLTADDSLNAALELLPQSAAMGVSVYVDGLSAVTPQVMRFLEALMTVATSLTISLTVDLGSEEDVFAPNRLAYDMLRRLAETKNILLTEKPMKKKPQPDAALAHLERHFFTREESVFEGDASSITLFSASSRMAEVRALCNTVIALARDGIRYREMAVVASDMEAYRPILERVHAAYGVPVFLNLRRPVRGHAAVEVLFSAVRACGSGFAMGDMLSLIKTGYAGASLTESALLENYVLRYGIHHGMFARPFTIGEGAAAAEQVRLKVMEHLVTLRDALAGKGTVHQRVLVCYQYLEEMGLRDKLEQAAKELAEAGRIAEAGEHVQIYNALVRVLEQMDTILQDTVTDAREFFSVLEEGISDVTLGVVPDSADSIQISPVARADGMGCRVLLVLGCTDGILPKDRSDDGLLNEEEKQAMAELGYPRLSGTGFIADFERQVFYGALTRPSEKAFFFYPSMADGNELLPSPYIKRLEAMFPTAVRLDDISLSLKGEMPSCRAAALEQMTDYLCEKADNGNTLHQQELDRLQAYFAETEPALSLRLQQAGVTGRAAAISPEMAHALYGEQINTSASRLEKFNSCPFAHFAGYGIGVQERPLYQNGNADIGTFYHAVLQLFFAYVMQQGIPLETITPQLQEEIFATVYPQAIAEHKEGAMLEDPHMRALFLLYRETAFQAVQAVIHQLLAGDFRPLGMEMKFNFHSDADLKPLCITTPRGAKVTIRGVIDRVDRAQGEKQDLYRIVDYKTGGRKLEYGSLYDGLTMQLPLYLAVMLENAPDGKAAGMYYMQLSIPTVKEEASDPEADFKLTGLTLSSGDALLATDNALLHPGSKSSVVKGLSINKDGSLSQRSDATAVQEQLELVLRRARDTVSRTVDRMLSGEVAATPYESACEYCKYRSLCRFDARIPGCSKKKKRSLNLERFLELAAQDRSGQYDGEEADV